MVQDPVCKMEVEISEALIAECEGEVCYFCSAGCRDQFLNEHPLSPNRTNY
jgi:YHS domain-containing protein